MPSLDILFSSHWLEMLFGKDKVVRSWEEPASFEAGCFSSWPLLGILAENLDSFPRPRPRNFTLLFSNKSNV